MALRAVVDLVRAYVSWLLGRRYVRRLIASGGIAAEQESKLRAEYGIADDEIIGRYLKLPPRNSKPR